MRLNRNLLLGLGALVGLALVAGLEGARRRPTSTADLRATTFGASPNGAKAFAETLDRLGVEVVRLRRHQSPGAFADSGHGVVVILDPSVAPTSHQLNDLVGLPVAGISLVVAGARHDFLLRCFGFAARRLADSVPVLMPTNGRRPWVRYRLEPTRDTLVADSTSSADVAEAHCRVPRYSAVDTLLVGEDGSPVAVRAALDQTDATITLVSDVGLFRNRTLRETDVGPTVLAWVAGRYDRVWFPEYLHGYQTGGSLVGWTLAWSWQSPWGWLVWHVGVVGLVALGFAAVRFGPPISTMTRRRRSITEHVSALARALRAAGGHRPAIGLLVSGLRRRLTPTGAPRGSWQGWLDGLAAGQGDPAISELARRLRRLDRQGASERDVLSAANIVEDLWSHLHS